MTLKGAARTTGVARSTLQRKLREGQIPGAERDPAGNWQIPIAGLVAAGIVPRITPADTPTDTPADTPSELERLRSENQQLRAERDAARAAERVYQQTNTALVEALAALRQLMPAPAPVEPTAATAVAPEPAQDTADTRGRLRRWWANL